MYVYIIQSISSPEKTYTGLTSNLKKRLQAHNEGRSKHTSKHRPWKLKAAVWLDEEEKARNLERYFKTGSERAWAGRHL